MVGRLKNLFKDFFVVSCGRSKEFDYIENFGGTVVDDATDENEDAVTHTIYSNEISDQYFAWAFDKRMPILDEDFFQACILAGKIVNMFGHVQWIKDYKNSRNEKARRYFTLIRQKRNEFLTDVPKKRGTKRSRTAYEHSDNSEEEDITKYALKDTIDDVPVDEKLPNNRTFNVCTDWPYWIEHDIEPEKLAHMLDTWYIEAVENETLDPKNSYDKDPTKFREYNMDPEYITDYIKYYSDLILELLTTHNNASLSYATFRDSKLAHALKRIKITEDDAFVYFYNAVEAIHVLRSDSVRRTETDQLKIYRMIIDKIVALFGIEYKTSNNEAIKMPERYTGKNSRIVPRTGTIISQQEYPLVIAEFKRRKKRGLLSNNIDYEKLLAEMKLYSDACIEKNLTKAKKFRTLGIIFYPDQLHVFVMEPVFSELKDNTIRKRYHNIYKVKISDPKDLSDISHFIAILLFHLHDDAYYALGTDYRDLRTSKVVISSTPKKPGKDMQVAARLSNKGRSSTSTRTARGKGDDKHTEDVSYNIRTVSKQTHIKEAQWWSTKDNLPIEIYVLQKVARDAHFVQMKNWKLLGATKYKIWMEKLRPLKYWHKSIQQKLWYMKNILSAIKTLHSMKIIHGDVKTRNSMIRRSDGRAVLIDFDLCKIMTAPKMPLGKLENSFGTLGYIAPELENREEYNELIDIYSCGIMFGEWIFENEYHRLEYETKAELVADIESQRQSENAEILKLIENMIADANTRISAEEALDRLCKIEEVI